MKTVWVGKRRLAPSKIICIGRNYVEHIKELGNELPDEMVVFAKANSAIGEKLIAFQGEPLHYEAEICYLIENGLLAAVGCGLDLTKRQLQSALKKNGLPWERAKGFDGAALFSSFVALPETNQPLEIELYVNNQLRQRGSTSMMLHSPYKILAEIKSFMSLEDGDLLMTGTPVGVGEVRPGERFSCRLLCGETVLTEAEWVAE